MAVLVTPQKGRAMICLEPMVNKIEVSKTSIQMRYSSSSLVMGVLKRYLHKHLAKLLEVEEVVTHWLRWWELWCKAWHKAMEVAPEYFRPLWALVDHSFSKRQTSVAPRCAHSDGDSIEMLKKASNVSLKRRKRKKMARMVDRWAGNKNNFKPFSKALDKGSKIRGNNKGKAMDLKYTP